jgi:energy-coupling factor transport system substrate-specific component
MGAIAGLAGAGRRPVPRRRDVVILAAIAVVTGFAYGALQDIWDWTAFYRGAPDFGYIQGASAGVLLQHFVRFYLATSAVWDSFRAGGDALAVIVLGLPVMSAMARVRSRLSFTIVHERLAEQAT